MRRHCGCKNSNCTADPNKMITPHTAPVYTTDTVQGHTIPSVHYSDLIAFLYPYYYTVNFMVNSIIQQTDASVCDGDCEY